MTDIALVNLCSGPATRLATHPPTPSASVLRRRRRTLFNAPLPVSSAGNEFGDLYNEDGTKLTIRSDQDLRRVAGYPNDWTVITACRVSSYPKTIELNEPWSIGAPGQQRDGHFAFALVNQISDDLSFSHIQPGPGDITACTFSRICRRQTPEYDLNYATHRAAREMCTIPLFKNPKLFMMPLKQEMEEDEDGWIKQAWYPWQVCTNCIAVRAKGRCSRWGHSIFVQDTLKVELRRPGEQTLDDISYAWFDKDMRDDFFDQDLGYFNE